MLHTFLPVLNLESSFSGKQVMYFQVFNKNCAPTYMLLLKTFVITVILMKPHQLCPCLSLIAFLCTLFLSYHIVTVKNVLSKYKLPVLSATLLSAGIVFQIRCWAFASMNSFFFAHARLWKADMYLLSAHFSLRTSRAQKEGVTKRRKKDIFSFIANGSLLCFLSYGQAVAIFYWVQSILIPGKF